MMNRIDEAKKILKRVADSKLITDIYQRLHEIHRCGICVYDIKYGNILIEKKSKKPYFIDFENSIDIQRTTKLIFSIYKKHDNFLMDVHLK